MFGVYNYISSRLAKGSPFRLSGQIESETPSFTLFSSLPPELRRRIWHYALPERLVEASLGLDQNGNWSCYSSKAIEDQDLRRLPVLFSVCVESREFCLEQFVPFANTFIHPTLDLLYVSWLPSELPPHPKFIPIRNQPLSKLHAVAITIAHNITFEGRFGSLVNCLVNVGIPEELHLSLTGSRQPSLYSDISGFSISNGEQVTLLNWPQKFEEATAESVRSHVLSAFAEQKEKTPGLKVPKLSKTLLQIYSGPR